MPFTTATANKILDQILKNTAFTPASAIYVALFTSDPGDTGASGEVSGGSYARQTTTFETAATKHTQNAGAITFASMPACTVTHFGLFSAASGGTYWWGGALTASKTVAAGDSLQIAVGDLDITLT
jgi:hypothetical protein